MSNIITVRDPEIIAAEINTIKKKVQETVIFSSIEIGMKLTEAKALVNHGEWGKWLQENVDYSQSTANYLMQLYQEYGSDQQSFFDAWRNSQTFAKLTYSQHIALLTLPADERQEFAEQNNVADMSTRQLQQALKERDEARKAQAEMKAELEAEAKRRQGLEADLETAQGNIDTLQEDLAKAQSNAADAAGQEKNEARKQIDAMKATVEVAEAAKARAEKSELNALKQLDALKKELEKAQAREKEIGEELKAAKENPDIPASMMETIRAEAEAAAAKKATEGLVQKFAAADEAAKAARIRAEAAEAQARKANEQLAAAQKSAKLAHPSVTAINILGQKMLKDWELIMQHRQTAITADPANEEPIKRFLAAVLNSLQGDMSQ